MEQKNRSLGRIIQDIINVILIALIVAVILRVFFISSSIIISSSMENTLKKDDYILIWKFLYNKRIPLIKKSLPIGSSIKRRDVIIFKYSKSDNYVKRVIGLPGDRIRIRKDRIYINGKLCTETCVKSPESTFYLIRDYKVPDNSVFVMGDNRNNSKDSRDIGFINMEDIIGKVFFIYYPFKRITFM